MEYLMKFARVIYYNTSYNHPGTIFYTYIPPFWIALCLKEIPLLPGGRGVYRKITKTKLIFVKAVVKTFCAC
jgi:hypothetical protein